MTPSQSWRRIANHVDARFGLGSVSFMGGLLPPPVRTVADLGRP
jgi:hypothetical protein